MAKTGECLLMRTEGSTKYGGVLEHPAYTDAWDAYELLKPPSKRRVVSKKLYDDGLGVPC